VLLGEIRRGKGDVLVDVTNSYAVPFEEDDQNPAIWFLDHNFHENMYAMYRKVNARENIVGWYSTGPKIRPSDLDINELFRKYTPNPVLVIIDVQPKEEFEIPTKGYVAVEEVKEDGTEAPVMAFHHITSEIGAHEAEEVGVEHLLRDIKDTSISTLATQLHSKLLSMKSLISHLQEMHAYLENVVSGRVPINHQILCNLQDIFNLAPNMNVEYLQKSFAVKTNDSMLVLYLSSLIRSVVALHSLINNKIENRELEKKADQEIKKALEPGKKVDEKDKKEKEKDPKSAAEKKNIATKPK